MIVNIVEWYTLWNTLIVAVNRCLNMSYVNVNLYESFKTGIGHILDLFGTL